MNKKELVDVAAEEAKVSKKDAEAVVNAMLNIIERELIKGEKVRLLGFGTFEVRTRKERVARNLHTREAIIVPAGKIPVFKAGKALKVSIDK